MLPAVNNNVGAGDPTRARAGDEGDDSRHFLRSAEAAESNRLVHLLEADFPHLSRRCASLVSGPGGPLQSPDAQRSGFGPTIPCPGGTSELTSAVCGDGCDTREEGRGESLTIHRPRRRLATVAMPTLRPSIDFLFLSTL
jgi:hypothetical protein